MRDAARQDGRVSVVVRLAVPQAAGGGWDRGAVVRAQDRLLDELGRGARVVTRYARVPQIALRVTPPALRRLRASPLVASISLEQTDPGTQ